MTQITVQSASKVEHRATREPLQATSASRLGVTMHGVTLTLEADHPPLIAYAAEHLHEQVTPPTTSSDLTVKCFWSQGEWDAEDNPFPSNGALDVIGKRMLGNGDELIWLDTLRMKGLQLRFRRAHGNFFFDVAYRFHPKKEKLESVADYEYKRYFSLMSYLVYYPIMWYLENFRGWTMMHVSALSSERGGILIGGLGGVGKTTTCVALMQRPGISLIAENLIFTDGEFIYPCYEPIRLDEGSLAMLGENPKGLQRMLFPEGLKEKWLFHFQLRETPEQARPKVIFLPQFSSRRYVRPISPESATEKILAMNRLTRELDDYFWYASALNMTWPKAGISSHRIEVVRRFCERVRCYELGIDRQAGVPAVVEDIMRVFDSF